MRGWNSVVVTGVGWQEECLGADSVMECTLIRKADRKSGDKKTEDTKQRT